MQPGTQLLCTTVVTSTPELFNAAAGSEGETLAKRQLRKGGVATLNIYTWGVPGGVLGWAYLPWRVPDSTRDGVVVHFNTINGGAFSGYNLGTTVVHEVGHWLGLYHTFEVSNVPRTNALHAHLHIHRIAGYCWAVETSHVFRPLFLYK
jgi:hypothetical protein